MSTLEVAKGKSGRLGPRPGPAPRGAGGRPVQIAASILSADFARLGEQIVEAEAAGADIVHVDVMDGHFVPNITVGPMVVRAVRRLTSLPVYAHLMIERPEAHAAEFAAAGADLLTVHLETTPHLHRLVELIRSLGKGAGVSLNPATPLCMLDEILSYVDLALVMTVNPGFGGQEFIPSMLEKVARLRAILGERGLGCEIEVDGGINGNTAAQVVAAGASILVAGAAIFEAPEGVRSAIRSLRARTEARNG